MAVKRIIGTTGNMDMRIARVVLQERMNVILGVTQNGNEKLRVNGTIASIRRKCKTRLKGRIRKSRKKTLFITAARIVMQCSIHTTLASIAIIAVKSWIGATMSECEDCLQLIKLEERNGK